MKNKFNPGDKVKINFDKLKIFNNNSNIIKSEKKNIFTVKKCYSNGLQNYIYLYELFYFGLFNENELILVSNDTGLICKKLK